MPSAEDQQVTGSARTMVEHVIRFGPLSRAELARRLDLSSASLTRLTKPLVETGLLVEVAREQRAATGRPAQLLDVVDGAHRFVGINLTGRDATGVVTDLRANVLGEQVAALPTSTDPGAVTATVRQLVAVLQSDAPDVLGLGISLGGHVRNQHTVVRAPFLGWHHDVDMGELLAAATGLPVVVDNDLLSLTRAEQWFGEGGRTDHFALLTIGAGVGYGLVVHDRIVADVDLGLGLLGHLPLDPLGPRCREGHRGCASAMLTTGSIESQAEVALRRHVSWEEVLELAAAGQAAVRAIVDDAGRALGRLIGVVANIAMPDTVVLGGEGLGLAEVAADCVQSGLAETRDPAARPVSLHVHAHQWRSWARGAAVGAIVDHIDNRLIARPASIRTSA